MQIKRANAVHCVQYWPPCYRFFSFGAEFGIWTVVGLDETLVEAKNTHIQVSQVRFLASASVPFRVRHTMVQMPNSALWDETDYTSVY